MHTRRYTDRPRAFRAQRPELETLGEYSARVLRYALIAGLHTLTDDQRARADMAAQRAASQITGPAPDYKASQADPASLATLEKLRDLRHQIAAYARLQAQAQAQPTAPAPAPDTTGGKGARLVPPTPTQPPSPAYAVPASPARRQEVEIAF